jgi:hypothetical protein
MNRVLDFIKKFILEDNIFWLQVFIDSFSYRFTHSYKLSVSFSYVPIGMEIFLAFLQKNYSWLRKGNWTRNQKCYGGV